MVLLAVVDVRPGVPAGSAAQRFQPFWALVLTLALIAEAAVPELERVPKAAALDESEKVKLGLTVAVTAIWSLVTLEVAQLLVSKLAVDVDRPAQAVVLALQVVMIPVLSLVALLLMLTE